MALMLLMITMAITVIHSRLTESIETYRICSGLECDFHTIGTYQYMVEGSPFTVEVVLIVIVIVIIIVIIIK